MEQTRIYRFRPFGPFEIPLESKSVIAAERLKEFWGDVEAKHPGLGTALGCYIFGIRHDQAALPWYVGKTELKTFAFEAFQSHKRLIYEKALRIQSGTALLYLIPRMTDGGKFRKTWSGGSPSVRRLEDMLIGTARGRNPNLLNIRQTKHLSQTQVPGYINEAPGKRTAEANKLAKLLGTLKQQKAT